MRLGPCQPDYSKDKVKALWGKRKALSARQIVNLKIPREDVIWCLSNLLTKKLMREAACQFAESVLPIYEREYPGDNRPRAAIEAGRAYSRGEIDDATRAAAWAAARDAAWAAARDAAMDAAMDAARDAAWAAARDAAWAAARDAARDARDAAWDAARDAEEQRQIKILLKLHREMS
jgi:hypothetical protein